MANTKLTLKAVKSVLSTKGVSIHKIEGEYKVYPKGTIGQTYFTDDLSDALGTGILMAARMMHVSCPCRPDHVCNEHGN